MLLCRSKVVRLCRACCRNRHRDNLRPARQQALATLPFHDERCWFDVVHDHNLLELSGRPRLLLVRALPETRRPAVLVLVHDARQASVEDVALANPVVSELGACLVDPLVRRSSS